MPYPTPSDQDHINTNSINIDSLTKALKTVTTPAEIGPNICGSLQCKIDTGASGNVMPLHIYAKLFLRCFTTDCKPTRPHLCDTRLTAYNGSNIPQFEALDTAIEWTTKGHQCSKHLQTRWYVADNTGPAILGLPSSSKVGIVQLNWAVKLNSRHDLTSPPNSSKVFTKVYPDWFEGIGQFPGTYHITLHDDAKSVVHEPRKCQIAMQPLVHEKLDVFIDQGVTFLVEEPTDLVSSLAYSSKANGKLWVCLDPKDLNTATEHDHYKTPTLEEITQELAKAPDSPS